MIFKTSWTGVSRFCVESFLQILERRLDFKKSFASLLKFFADSQFVDDCSLPVSQFLKGLKLISYWYNSLLAIAASLTKAVLLLASVSISLRRLFIFFSNSIYYPLFYCIIKSYNFHWLIFYWVLCGNSTAWQPSSMVFLKILP